VLLEDSLGLVRGKRVGLLTNQTGIDRAGTPDADLLQRAPQAVQGGVRLVALFSPEHGIKGTEDRQNVAGGVDTARRVPVYSLYGATVLEPPDSLLQGLDVFVVDLQDVGTRTWTYVASVVYAMRAAARRGLPVVVLDRPNPITGLHPAGPLLDSGLAYAGPGEPGHAARPYALAPIPLRHALTMGELALYYNDMLGIHATLHIVPSRGWRRALWFDQTGLSWVRPSPNLPDQMSVLIYPALVAFEGSNLSVGRGTSQAFHQLGAPWLDGARVASLLSGRRLPGAQIEATEFTPEGPTDGKYAGRRCGAVRIIVTDREAFDPGVVGGALLWALARLNADSLRIDTTAFDLRFGSAAARRALTAGEDPDSVAARWRGSGEQFEANVARYRLYR
jgi:uncharacterized protein YbbC (DUF1343 family)